MRPHFLLPASPAPATGEAILVMPSISLATSRFSSLGTVFCGGCHVSRKPGSHQERGIKIYRDSRKKEALQLAVHPPKGSFCNPAQPSLIPQPMTWRAFTVTFVKCSMVDLVATS